MINLFAAILLALPSMLIWAQESEPLVIVMGEDSYPYQYVDDMGEARGLLVDTWKAWSMQVETPVVFVSRHWNDSLKQLSLGHADLHIGMAKTASRSNDFLFADQISSVNTYLYLHRDLQQINNFSEISPYQVGIVSGSSHETELLAQSPSMIFKRYLNRDKLLQGVIKGEVKIFAGMEGYLRDHQLNKQIIDQFPLSNRLLIKQVPIRPAINLTNKALLDKVNNGFAMLESAIFTEIEQRWTGIDQSQVGISIATAMNLEPYVSFGGDKQPHGLYVDIWRLWSEKTGIPISFITSEFNESVDNVLAGRASVHIGYPESDEFKTGLLRSQLLYKVKSRLHSFGQPIVDLDSIKGTRVGAVPTAPYLSELKQALPDVELKLYDSVAAMIVAAKEGHISSFVAASSWTHHYLVLNDAWSDFYPYSDIEFVTDIYVLTHLNNTGLAKRVKAGFELIDNSALVELEKKWIINSQDRIYDNQQSPLPLTIKQQDYLSELDTIKVGYLKDWKPMEYTDRNGDFAGINSEVASLFSDSLGLNIEPIVFNEWQSLINALIKGDVDIAGSVAKTAERGKKLLFSEPYWPSPWALATPIDREVIFNLHELAGQRLAIIEGYQLLNNIMAADYGIEFVLVADAKAGLKSVAEGKADAFVDKAINMATSLKHGDYSQIKMSVLADFSAQHSHFGVHPKLAQLVPLMNIAIKQLNQNKRESIYQNWLAPAADNGHSQLFKWCLATLGALGLLLVTLGAANYFIIKEKRKNRQLEAKLEKMSNYDQLTGYPNRALLDDRLAQSILLHSREQALFSVLFIDIGGLKAVNKSASHKVGDQLLVMVANELESCLRRSDTLARFGSNEFVVILNKTKDLDLVCQVADTIISQLSKTFEYEELRLNVDTSIGIAMFPADGDNAVDLVKSADKLMYRAKQSGGNCYKSA
ncbi:transporter substrate-binding domain-containing protein [Shewanella sp. UCD-KL12]|uniref:transporter substrate-binding domain-containing protein n=1 Tax=Shewanella sp. UCD-KL12 TaxID=1917163 RepID=UPI0021169C51|nr:transporter substrate-binding domain-containing protein [Shewanella sp. UCD-KL12]